MTFTSLVHLLFLFSLFLSHFTIITTIQAVFNPATKPIISFCIGFYHACAVFDTLQMKCWGRGSSFGSSTNYGSSPSTVGDNIPYFNPGTSLSITKVGCSNSGSCVAFDDGRIKCAGANDYGQAGIGVTSNSIIAPTYIGDTLPYVNLGTNVAVSDVIGGLYHNCVLTTTNQVKCFGRNDFGQLGYGDTVSRGASALQMGSNLTYIDFGIDVEIASVHSGPSASHNCVILSAPASVAQRIKCWGLNNLYQLGYGDQNNRGDAAGEMGEKLPLVDFGTESRVKQIAIGTRHKCTLLVNDALKCIGGGAFGQLASGSTITISSTGISIPSVLIDSGKTIKLLSSTDAHNCIVYDDMITMKCFGDNDYGQLGQGDILQRGNTLTTRIPFIPAIELGNWTFTISSIHSGVGINCVVFRDNSVKCIGYNQFGTLAIGTNQNVGDGPSEMGNNLTFSELFSPTKSPTTSPTNVPTLPTLSPTHYPSLSPTLLPTINPTKNPSNAPSQVPTSVPTSNPSLSPSKKPTISPSTTPSSVPTSDPSSSPSLFPTLSPTNTPTIKPTLTPTTAPTTTPSVSPTNAPSVSPSQNPQDSPTSTPTISPTITPSIAKSTVPTLTPTDTPTISPTSNLTISPSLNPTSAPTLNPSLSPSKKPTISPSTTPSLKPSSNPTTNPTSKPSTSPSIAPLKTPSISPTTNPSTNPTITPTKLPSSVPSLRPSHSPSVTPTKHPTISPTRKCNYYSAKLCKHDYNCMWANDDESGEKICMLFDCKALKKGKCGKERTRCKWNKKSKICNPKQKW